MCSHVDHGFGMLTEERSSLEREGERERSQGVPVTRQTVIFTHSSHFDGSSLIWKVSILSDVGIVKIVMVHFGTFWENAGKILNKFQCTNQ